MKRSGRVVAGLVVLALVGVLLVVWTRSRPRAPVPAPPPPVAMVDAGVGPAPARPAARAPLRLLPAAVARDEAAAAGSFAGRVVSATSGQPVPGAELSFVRGVAATSITAGADGRFTFAPAASGTWALAAVTAAGYLPFAPELGQSPIVVVLRPGVRLQEVVVALTPAVEYVGQVLEPTGKPAAGAVVRLVGLGYDAAAGAAAAPLAPLPDRFVADAKGEFRFRAPDGSVLEARHGDFAPARARLDFAAQVSHRLLLRLGPPGTVAATRSIAGRVLAADGAAVAGVTVTAEARPAAPAAPEAPPQAPARAPTDAEGRFLLTGLDPGRYDLAASRGTLAVGWARDVAAGASDVVIRLAAAGRLSGTVRAQAGGQPVASFAVVVVRLLGPLDQETAAVRAFFDGSGRYAVDDLAAGDYSVSVAAHGFAVPPRRRVTVPAGAGATADFELSRGARLSGTVIDGATRRPLEGAAVSIEGRAGLTAEVPLATRASTDAAGRFVLEGLPAGRCSLFVAASGHHARIVGPLSVAGDEELAPVTVDLTPLRPGEEPSVELCGIGAVLTARDDGLTVQAVIAGGGAAEVGLVPGDVVLAVDGQATTALGLDGAIQLIRGPEGTTVRLSVRRTTGATEELTVPRRRVRR